MVLAFLPDVDWTTLKALQRRTIRAELRCLGAVLVVSSSRGTWWFDPEREAERFDEKSLSVPPGYGPLAPDENTLFVLAGGSHERVRFVHRWQRPHRCQRPHERDEPELFFERLTEALRLATQASAREAPAIPPPTRREFLVFNLVAALTWTFLENAAAAATTPSPAETAPATDAPAAGLRVRLRVNGVNHPVTLDPRVSLLDALRDHLRLTGTKKGCDQGQCGACTVMVGDRRVLSCLTLAATVDGVPVTTIEGLAHGERLHPLQAAFVAHDGLQCGYCTPGQIMSAVGLLKEGHARTDDEVRLQMSGNLCRCGAYPGIVAAIQAARKEL